jgi:hypothetical protein
MTFLLYSSIPIGIDPVETNEALGILLAPQIHSWL